RARADVDCHEPPVGEGAVATGRVAVARDRDVEAVSGQCQAAPDELTGRLRDDWNRPSGRRLARSEVERVQESGGADDVENAARAVDDAGGDDPVRRTHSG